MKLPYRNNAYIPPKKLVAYLLSQSHAVGKSKAKFFRKYGFNETNITRLEQGLLRIAHTEEVTEIIPSPHGIKYIVEGTLNTPRGINVHTRTVWMIETGEQNPRFITAYPSH